MIVVVYLFVTANRAWRRASFETLTRGVSVIAAHTHATMTQLSLQGV